MEKLQMANELEDALSSLATSLAGEAVKKIAQAPGNYAAHEVILYDLNSELTRACLEKYFPDNAALRDMAPALACELPSFDTARLYEKRQNLAAMAGMTLLGWFLGGAVSGLLSLVGMGGDILRVAGVFAMFWLSEYLSSSPRVRKTILACLGLSGLARMASSALGGFVGVTGIRQAIFGMGRLPNIFKAGWLFLGSFFVFVFMAKKIDGLNIAAFEESLGKQTLGRLRLVHFVFDEIAGLSARKAESGDARRMAAAVADMLDGLPEEKRAHLRQALKLGGFETPKEEKWLIWNDARDRELYDPVGMVKDGDRCLILSRPVTGHGKIRRGRAQRVD